MSSYWKEYWDSVSSAPDLQAQVGRTHKKEPVNDDVFRDTLDFVARHMKLQKDSKLLDLCCGNGLFSIPFSKLVSHITAVDFSLPLLATLRQRLNDQNVTTVSIINSDVTSFSPKISYTHALLYFALQHFSEQESISFFEKVFSCLEQGGVFYIGDIPDREKLWTFANTAEYEKIYFDNLKNNTPAIGTWFLKNDLLKLANYTGFSSAEIIMQPDYQINSKYRFDMKLIK
jgi:cyclopropane fatty-acyl-phospholipid synthase-like methyltransferase